MNYRHAFHAGNFADVLKHAVLARILRHLLLKPKPFRFVDTHAGIGRYDLAADEAERTGEWRDGVGRLAEPLPAEAEALLAPYRSALAATRLRFGESAYPGSPEIACSVLRETDSAVLIERHPADHDLLRARFGRRPRVTVLGHDGWAGLRSLIPPVERRGLVLVDPPYEEAGELGSSFLRLAQAHRRWPTGIVMLWYPLKGVGELDGAMEAAFGPVATPRLHVELRVRRSADGRLAGSGLVIVNPPWTLAAEARILLPALAERLDQDGQAAARIEVHGEAGAD